MANTHERIAQDICYRLQVCFPEYRIQTEVWESGFRDFVALHLSRDGRDEWEELITDRDGGTRRIFLQSFHLQIPFPPSVDPEYAGMLINFRRSIVERFIHEWFSVRIEAAGVEP